MKVKRLSADTDLIKIIERAKICPVLISTAEQAKAEYPNVSKIGIDVPLNGLDALDGTHNLPQHQGSSNCQNLRAQAI